MVKKKKTVKNPNLDRFVWKEGDIEIVQSAKKKPTVKKKVKKMIKKKG